MATRRARSPTRRQPGRPGHATALTASQHRRLKRLRSISPVRKMLARRFPKTLNLKGSMLDPEKDAELIDSDVLALQDILTSDVSDASEKVSPHASCPCRSLALTVSSPFLPCLFHPLTPVCASLCRRMLCNSWR